MNGAAEDAALQPVGVRSDAAPVRPFPVIGRGA